MTEEPQDLMAALEESSVQETKIARAALREIGLGPIAEHVHSRRSKTGMYFPSFAGSPIDFNTIPFEYAHLVRKAFLLAHKYHCETAFVDKRGGIHCEACHPAEEEG